MQSKNTNHIFLLIFDEVQMFPQARAAIQYLVADGKNFNLVDAEKRDILKIYRNDIMKIKARYRGKVLAIFDQIPGLLSGHEKRVVFKDIQKGSYADQYSDIFFAI